MARTHGARLQQWQNTCLEDVSIWLKVSFLKGFLHNRLVDATQKIVHRVVVLCRDSAMPLDPSDGVPMPVCAAGKTQHRWLLIQTGHAGVFDETKRFMAITVESTRIIR